MRRILFLNDRRHLGRALRPCIQDKKIVQAANNFSLRFSIKSEAKWLIEWNFYEAR